MGWWMREEQAEEVNGGGVQRTSRLIKWEEVEEEEGRLWWRRGEGGRVGADVGRGQDLEEVDDKRRKKRGNHALL